MPNAATAGWGAGGAEKKTRRFNVGSFRAPDWLEDIQRNAKVYWK